MGVMLKICQGRNVSEEIIINCKRNKTSTENFTSFNPVIELFSKGFRVFLSGKKRK